MGSLLLRQSRFRRHQERLAFQKLESELKRLLALYPKAFAALQKHNPPRAQTLLTGFARKLKPTPDEPLPLALHRIRIQADLIRKTKNYPFSAEDKLIAKFRKHPDWTITRLTEECGIRRQTAYKCKTFIQVRKLLMEQARKDLTDKLPRGYRDKDTGWVEVHKK